MALEKIFVSRGSAEVNLKMVATSIACVLYKKLFGARVYQSVTAALNTDRTRVKDKLPMQAAPLLRSKQNHRQSPWHGPSQAGHQISG